MPKIFVSSCFESLYGSITPCLVLQRRFGSKFTLRLLQESLIKSEERVKERVNFVLLLSLNIFSAVNFVPMLTSF
jgi:hypothetical protein